MHPLAKKFIKSTGWGFVSSIAYTVVRDQWRFRSLKGAVVVITGGSRGLGLVLAKEYARHGASIALLARDEDELRRARNILALDFPETLVHWKVCDCTKSPQVEQAIESIMQELGKIDVLVNNAGVIASTPFQNATKKDFTESIDVHFWAPYNMVRSCLPYLKKGSRIVNISSIGGIIPIPHRAPYCTGKFALTGFSESLRSELQSDGIYVTTVIPGLMRTGSVDHAKFKGQTEKEYALFSLAASMPLITTSAERAARQIVHATKLGQAELKISFSTKLASIVHAHFPGMFADLVGLANYALPAATNDSITTVEGKDAHSRLSPSVLTTLSNKAAERNNEVRPGKTS